MNYREYKKTKEEIENNFRELEHLKVKKLEGEIERLNNIIKDKKERVEIAIRLLLRMFGTDDYEINYVMGILSGDRQIHFEELKGDSNE